MAPPASSRALARLAFTLLLAALNIIAPAATFPLPLPTRPTSFPLSRPTQIGEVVVWGANSFGQTSVPSGLTNVVAISAGSAHLVALRNDGTVVCWGDNQYHQTNVPAGLNGVVAISAGAYFSLALGADGKVTAWGDNSYNQCNVPSSVSAAVSIATGYNHALALAQSGKVVAWGNNTSNESTIPPEGTNVIAIAAGPSETALILSDRSVLFWSNQYSPQRYYDTEVADVQFDHEDTRLFLHRRDGGLVPGQVWWADWPLDLRPIAVRFNYGHGVALNGDGTVTCWGRNEAGETNVPVRLRSVIDIAAGHAFSAALKIPTPPIPTTAIASAQIANGFIIGLNIIDGGEGYDVPPKVTITGGGGSGATATAQISRGIVTNFTMISAGSGYTSQPTIAIDPPPFLPKLSIAPSRVNVVLQVVPGKRYQLESSDDLPNFSPVGSPFTATSNTITNEFTLSDTGQFFRIQEIP